MTDYFFVRSEPHIWSAISIIGVFFGIVINCFIQGLTVSSVRQVRIFLNSVIIPGLEITANKYGTYFAYLNF